MGALIARGVDKASLEGLVLNQILMEAIQIRMKKIIPNLRSISERRNLLRKAKGKKSGVIHRKSQIRKKHQNRKRRRKNSFPFGIVLGKKKMRKKRKLRRKIKNRKNRKKNL